EHSRDRPRWRHVEARAVACIELGVVLEEPVETELAHRLGLHLPGQEASDGIAPHEGVEERHDLRRSPHVLTLDRREDELPALDPPERLHDGRGWLIAHRALL